MNYVQSDLTELQTVITTSDFDGNLKIHLFPEALNQILIRIENIDDLFDSTLNATEGLTYPTFNVKTYANELYSKVNQGTSAADVSVTERTLINNQDYADWQTEKYAWKSESDSTDPDAGSYPQDTGDKMVL